MNTSKSSNSNIQIPIFLFALLVPFAGFYVLYSTAFGSVLVEDYLMYSVLCFIILGYSLYTTYYYYRLYVESAKAPLLFASLSTFAFTIVFFAHSFITPIHDNTTTSGMMFDITEHYSLFFSALFFIGAVLPFQEKKGSLYRNWKLILSGVATAIALGLVGALSSVTAINVLYGALNIVLGLTGVIYIVLALLFVYRFSRTHDLLLLYYILGFTIMASSAYIPFFYTAEWSLLWWYSLLALAVGYTAIFVGFINYKNDDLSFSLFFGGISFYKKIGTKLVLTIFSIGLLPLLLFGVVMYIGLMSLFDSVTFASLLSSTVLSPSAESLRLLIFRFVLLVSLLFVLAAFFSFYFASKLVLPLKKLSTAAIKLAQGETGVLVEVKTGDEIEQLAGAFNTMSGELQQFHSGLKEKIQDQTAEISEKLSTLEQSKQAMLNLLEDSKFLEERLAEEKENVEKKVVERTQELKEERAKLLASIESLSFGFIIADTNDNIVVKNEALSEILELVEEPTTVHGLAGAFRGVSSGLETITNSCRECIDLKKVVEIKEVSHGKKYLRVFCTPILTKEGSQEETLGYVMLVEDITEAKVMERSRDEFFAVASHELRTPLTAIRGNADMILDMYADKIIDKDMKEMLQDIDISSVRLISVVNDFLEVSRLEQGRVEIKKEPLNVSEVVEKVVRDLKAMVEQKGLSLIYTAPASPLPMVSSDKSKVEQILINLVGNAVKFTKGGSITITTSVADGFVSIRVTDTGLGISEHNQTLLFRKFQQAGEQMLARDVTQSTGLGLYISKLIIENMGGTIGLERSELDKGSTFFFTLPIADKI